MGIIDAIFPRRNRAAIEAKEFFQMLNGYSPVFSNAPESVYEMDITRSAIHSFATFCSKLKPEIQGSAYQSLEKTLQFRPNPFMDTSKFLYRIATILAVNNTAFIVPMEDESGRITGYFPIIPENCEVVKYQEKPFLRYTFANGERAAIEFEKVGIVTQYQYKDDFFGADNAPLKPLMQLMHVQNQGMINSIKSSAAIRFIAKATNMIKDDDIEKERKNFTERNLSMENKSGMIIFDNKFKDIQPVDVKALTINAAQMKLINENAYRYYGTNEKILQNMYSEDDWNAYYEGKIEPFAIQLSLVMSNMTFSSREIAQDNAILFSSSRLQYASNQTKLQMSTQLFDRGFLSLNGIADIWNMAHVEDGDKRYIRKEYTEVANLDRTDL